ncbi:MAG: hypothetical protein F9K30_08725 [Dechloromonas sp.]|nr:MAG: hypothetical protein F9K30_08725 [Dechloromonas sp.]
MVILIGEKARLAIDAVLNDVQRVTGQENARTVGHGYWFRKLNVSDPFCCLLLLFHFHHRQNP